MSTDHHNRRPGIMDEIVLLILAGVVTAVVAVATTAVVTARCCLPDNQPAIEGNTAGNTPPGTLPVYRKPIFSVDPVSPWAQVGACKRTAPTEH